MIGLLQRVSSASVRVAGRELGAVERGLLVLVGVQQDDGEPQVARLLERLLSYRVFPDEAGRMNLSLREIGGGLLLVPQFTLYADTAKGRRPSWQAAAPGPVAEPLVDAVITELRKLGATVATGRFGADMKVALVNDGPVTIILEI